MFKKLSCPCQKQIKYIKSRNCACSRCTQSDGNHLLVYLALSPIQHVTNNVSCFAKSHLFCFNINTCIYSAVRESSTSYIVLTIY